MARGRKSQFWLHYPVSLPLQLNTKRNATHPPERIRAKGLLQKGRFEAGASNLNIKRCRAGGAELEPLLPWLRERPQKKKHLFPLDTSTSFPLSGREFESISYINQGTGVGGPAREPVALLVLETLHKLARGTELPFMR